MKLAHLITQFLQTAGTKEIDVYNEFSLQHELGHYLRNRISKSKGQFERNVSHFNFKLAKSSFEKKEIDIAITSIKPEELLCAIESKFPRNGQVPSQCSASVETLHFLSNLCRRGFNLHTFWQLLTIPYFIPIQKAAKEFTDCFEDANL
jgi:hypothetical protein